MRIAPRPFFALSSLVFIAAAGFCAWKLLPVENGGVMSCSTKAIMRFENMEKENVNGNIHFNFAANGKGSMVVEGYTDSAAGWLYLQRYVKFSYTSKRISTTERHYRISKWESSASSIDESPDVIFDYFMRDNISKLIVHNFPLSGQYIFVNSSATYKLIDEGAK